MPDNRQVLRFGTLDRARLLAFMAAFAPHFADALRCEARFGISADRQMRVVLPHSSAKPHRPGTEVQAVTAAIRAAFQSVEQPVPNLDPVSHTLDGMFDAAGAALVTILMAAEEDQTRQWQGGQSRIAVIRGADPAQSELVAATLRRSRYPAMIVSGDSLGEETVTVVRLSDDPDIGATIDGLRAGLVADVVHLLCPVETAAGTIYLPDRLSLSPQNRAHAAAVLTGLHTIGKLTPGAAILLIPLGDGGVLACQMLEDQAFTPSVELVTDQDVGDWLSLHIQRIAPSEFAAKALVARIVDAKFPVGYKIALRAVPDRVRLEADVELLREEIEEREAEIALIRALAAPQMRLLRFTDAQLPALVEGLRLMPPSMQLNRELTFATAQSSGQTQPAHYILYDPSRVAIEGRVPEYYWRRMTDDHPIGYWLDPYGSAAMTGRTTEPLIFVPNRHQIVPNVSAFGGTLDATMRLVLGNLFADASAILDDPDARPLFVFSPPTEPTFEMELEVLDHRKFQPISLRLRWINDHILVRSPRLFEPATMAEIAEAVFGKALAPTLANLLTADLERVTQAWQDGETALSAQIGDIGRALTAEVVESADRIGLAIDFLHKARRRIAEVDRATALMKRSLDRVETAASALDHEVDRKAADRNRFANDLLTEIEIGERTIAQATDRIAVLRTQINDLLDRWDRDL